MASITMNWARRPAVYRPNKYRAHLIGVEAGTEILVDVLGLFQFSDDDGPVAYFVVELPNGKCYHAEIDEVQFTDKEEMR